MDFIWIQCKWLKMLGEIPVFPSLLYHTNLETKSRQMFVKLITLTHVCMKEYICVHRVLPGWWANRTQKCWQNRGTWITGNKRWFLKVRGWIHPREVSTQPIKTSVAESVNWARRAQFFCNWGWCIGLLFQLLTSGV